MRRSSLTLPKIRAGCTRYPSKVTGGMSRVNVHVYTSIVLCDIIVSMVISHFKFCVGTANGCGVMYCHVLQAEPKRKVDESRMVRAVAVIL